MFSHPLPYFTFPPHLMPGVIHLVPLNDLPTRNIFPCCFTTFAQALHFLSHQDLQNGCRIFTNESHFTAFPTVHRISHTRQISFNPSPTVY